MKSDGYKMRILFASAWALSLLCGCTMTRSNISSISAEPASTNANIASPKTEVWEADRVFTNAHVVMWVPSRSKPIWDGPTTVIHVDETTPPGAFVKDYKIVLDIEIVNTTRELQQMERWAASNWYFQEHTALSTEDGQAGRQMRKDIWDAERKRRLLINALVERSNTFDEDVETTKKMIESIKLIKAQPDDIDFWNRLTSAEVECAKKEIDHLQPYMTPNDCTKALGMAERDIPTLVWDRGGLIKTHGPIMSEQKFAASDWQPNENQRISMTLREGHVLLLVCDHRGYVISTRLDDRKWEWKQDEKKP
jgi:hypothetical protein